MRKQRKYWYSIVTLSYNNYFKADMEKTYTFVDTKGKLSNRQILNRIEENYRIRPERIARVQINLAT